MMHDAPQKQVDRLMEAAARTAAEAKEILVPVSGGSDSAFTFWLLNQVFPGKVFGIFAKKIRKNPFADTPNLRGSEWFREIGRVESRFINHSGGKEEERRWCEFLALALSRNAWLVGSRNRTEDELGTYSLASRVATYLPIVGVWKSDVMTLCRHVGIPDEVISSSYRADPNCGRPKKLAEIPFECIEIFLRAKADGTSMHPLMPDQIAYLENVYAYNRFKSSLPLRGPKP